MSGAPGIGLMTLDTALRIRSWNHWLAAATGLPESAVLGRAAIDVVSPSQAPAILDVLAEVRDTGSARVLSPTLHRGWFHCPPTEPSPYFDEMQQRITVAPLRGEAGTVGLMVTFEDLTARLTEERHQALAQAGSGARRVADVGADDWRTRAAAVRDLQQAATREDVAELLAVLQRDHQNLSVLSGALQVLIAMRRDVAAPLIELLSGDDPNLRIHAALALGALGEVTGIPALIDTLADSDPNVRFHAIEALGRLGAAEAVGTLGAIARSGDFFLAFPAIDALARIDDPSVVPTLVTLVDDDLLCPAVVDALASLGDEDCVVPLITLLNDGRGDTAAIAAAVGRIAARYDDTFNAGDTIIDLVRAAITSPGVARLREAAGAAGAPAEAVVTVLGWGGAAVLDALLPLLGQPDVRDSVNEAVRRIGRDATGPLTGVLRNGEPDARVAAAQLCGTIGDAAAIPALIESLSSHDSRLVAAAAGALATLNAAASLDPLLLLFGHPDVMVRQAAVAAVSSISAADTPERIRRALNDADPRVRECAVRVAGYFGFDACMPAIYRALRDEADDLRRAAIEQLPLLDDDRAADHLVAALRDETPRNRGAAAHALRAVPGTHVEAALIDALADADAWVRYFAAGSLAQQRSLAAVQSLLALAHADRAPHVRIAAVQAVGAIAPSVLVDTIGAGAVDADAEVAAAAIVALGQADAAEADRLLERAMHSSGHPSIQMAAVEALGHRGTNVAVESLTWAARLAEPAAIAPRGAAALARIAASPDAEGRAAAVVALLAIGTDPARRADVTASLCTLPADAIPILGAALQSPRVDVRTIAVEVLARMRDPDASRWLATALEDAEAEVRAAAVAAFGRLGSPGAAARVASMSGSDPDPRVQRRALTVCRRYGWGRDGILEAR